MGSRNWSELVRWLVVYNISLVLNTVPVFIGWGCLGLILLAVAFQTAPDKNVGSSLKNYGFVTLALSVYPLVMGAGLGAGLVSLQAQLVVSLIALAPFVALCSNTSLGSAPKLIVAFGGYAIQVSNGADADRLVTVLLETYGQNLLVIGGLWLVTLALWPSSGLKKARSLLSNCVSNMARGVSSDASDLLQASEAPAVGSGGGGPVPSLAHGEAGKPEEDLAPDGLHLEEYDDENLALLRKAEELFGDAVWEPNIRHLRHCPDLEVWKRLVRKVKRLVITRSVLQSALLYSHSQYGAYTAFATVFDDEGLKACYVEIGALAGTILEQVANRITGEDEEGAFVKSQALEWRLEQLMSELKESAPVVLEGRFQNEAVWKNEMTAGNAAVLVAVTLTDFARQTLSVRREAEEIGGTREIASNWNVLHNLLGWLTPAPKALMFALRPRLPDLSSPAAFRALLVSPHTVSFVRLMAIVTFLMWLDLFVLSTRVNPGQTGWVFLSAVLVYTPTVELTVKRSVLRLIGTVLGALLGALPMFSPVFATSPVLLMVYLCGISTLLLLTFDLIPKLHDKKYAELMTAVTLFMASACQFKPNCTEQCAGTWDFTIVRTVAVIVGSLLSVFVQMVLFPRYARRDAREGISRGLCALLTPLRTWIGWMEALSAETAEASDPPTAYANASDDSRLRAEAAGLKPKQVTGPPNGAALVGVSSMPTRELHAALEGLEGDIRSIRTLLGQTRVMSDDALVITTGAPMVLHDICRQFKLYYVFLTCLWMLASDTDISSTEEAAQEAAVVVPSWTALSSEIGKVMQSLQLMVKLCANAIERQDPAELQNTILDDVLASLLEARYTLWRAFRTESRHVWTRAYQAGSTDCGPLERGRFLAAHLVSFNCAYLAFESMFDALTNITKSYRVYSGKQLARSKRWWVK